MNKKILDKLNTILSKDGYYNTFLDEVKLFKTTKPKSFTPYIYDNWIVFTFQNSKTVKLNNHTLVYDESNYLVASSTFPLQSETKYASIEKPMISMIVSIDLNVIFQLIKEIFKKEEISYIESQKSPEGTFIDSVTPKIEDTLYRLIETLEDKQEAKILGKQILKELFYRVLKGKNAKFLYKLFDKSSKEAKIARVLKNIHDNFSEYVDIQSLAKKEDMSVASFHVYFKKITGYTPFQYLKKIRLTKARDLIVQENLKVHEAATKVGYENSFHFSKEFKKYFGYPPKEAKAPFEEYYLDF